MKKVMAVTLTALLSLSWMAGCAATPNQAKLEISSEPSPIDPLTAPIIDPFPYGLVMFNGNQYWPIDFDSTSISKEMVGEKLGESSRFLLDTELPPDPSPDFVNRIGKNAVFYSIKNYDPSFRILAENEGIYYICQNSDATAKHLLDHKDQIQYGAIYSSLDSDTALKTLDQQETIKILEIFATTEKSTSSISDKNFEQILETGKAYDFQIVFEDQTSVSFFTIPELNSVSMGLNDYTSDSLGSDIAFAFQGVPQITE